MTIAEFFLRLATDDKLQRDFNADAHATLSREGLSDEQRALLLSGEPRELRVKVEAEFYVEHEKVAYSTVYTVPTVYIPPPPPPDTTTTQS
ncbi:MAG TPA: hypothetical protein VIL77_05045 [Gaiellaceae bacterium]